MPNPAPSSRPIQFTSFTAKELATEPGVARLNLLLSQYTTQQNQLIGTGGPAVLASGVDVQGSPLTGLPAPASPTDAVSLAHADANYSPSQTAPSFDIGGKNMLKGLAFAYQQTQTNTAGVTTLAGQIAAIEAALATGITTVIPLAKLTGGGTNGSITVTGGIITAAVDPT